MGETTLNGCTIAINLIYHTFVYTNQAASITAFRWALHLAAAGRLGCPGVAGTAESRESWSSKSSNLPWPKKTHLEKKQQKPNETRSDHYHVIHFGMKNLKMWWIFVDGWHFCMEILATKWIKHGLIWCVWSALVTCPIALCAQVVWELGYQPTRWFQGEAPSKWLVIFDFDDIPLPGRATTSFTLHILP